MLPSLLTNTIEQFILYVHRNEAMKNVSPAFMYIIPMYLRLKGAPPTTLLTAGALTDPQLPATASNVCTTDAGLDGVDRVPPSQKNPGCARGMVTFEARSQTISIFSSRSVWPWMSSLFCKAVWLLGGDDVETQ